MLYVNLTPEALAATRDPITPEIVERDARIFTEFLDYLRWLTDQDTSFQLTSGHVWALLYEGALRCRMWSEVCEEIGLPVREDW